MLPTRAGDPGSVDWAAVTLRAVHEGDVLYAEWGAAGALDYARDVDGVGPPVGVVRRRPAVRGSH